MSQYGSTVCVRRHCSAQQNLARNCASDDTTTKALNFVLSKSHFRYSKAVLHVYIFRHYPGMSLIDQSCTAEIFFIIKTHISVLFVCDVQQTCQSNQILVSANQTRI